MRSIPSKVLAVLGLVLLVLAAKGTFLDWKDTNNLSDAAEEGTPLISNKSLPPVIDTYALEKETFALINRERAKVGLEKLEWSPEIAQVARRHSLDMAFNGYFDHVDRLGDNVDDRMEEAGLNYEVVGENIFKVSVINAARITYLGEVESSVETTYKNPSEMVGEVVREWMNSPDHRRNILSREYTTSGVGVVPQEEGYYFTQDFAGNLTQ